MLSWGERLRVAIRLLDFFVSDYRPELDVGTDRRHKRRHMGPGTPEYGCHFAELAYSSCGILCRYRYGSRRSRSSTSVVAHRVGLHVRRGGTARRCRHSLGRSDTEKDVASWSAFCAAGPGRAVICALPGVWYVVEPPRRVVVEAVDGYCGGSACCAANPI